MSGTTVIKIPGKDGVLRRYEVSQQLVDQLTHWYELAHPPTIFPEDGGQQFRPPSKFPEPPTAEIQYAVTDNKGRSLVGPLEVPLKLATVYDSIVSDQEPL